MTVNLNIEPGVEEKLTARAEAIGVPLERFIEDVLEREAAWMESKGANELSGPEKAKAFRAWTESFPLDLPALSIADVSRESIYRRD
jgi:hypothetical protein